VQTYKGVDSKFRLVILAARRAKQLIAGDRKRVDIKAENPLTVALEELRQGKIDVEHLLKQELIFAESLPETAEGEIIADGETADGIERDQAEIISQFLTAKEITTETTPAEPGDTPSQS